MASIDGYKQYITGATGSQGVLAPQASWKAYVLPRGAHASQASSGALITFDSANAAARFPANYWVQVGLNTSSIRQVSAVGGNSINVGTAVTVAEGDRIFLIGTTQPTVTGGSASYQPHTTIYSRDDNGGSAITNSKLTSDANGGFEFFSAPGYYDLLIQDSNNTLQTSIVDASLGAFSGLTITGYSSYFNNDVVVGGSGMLRVTYDTILPSSLPSNGAIAARFGGRAQTTGDNRTLVYASETYTAALSDETAAVYGINQISNSTGAAANAFGVQGEVQFNPSTAVTALGSVNGGQFWGRYAATNPSAAATIMRGLLTRVITSSGSTGTITTVRGHEVQTPLDQGHVAMTTIQNLFVQGASAGQATGMNAVAIFNSGDNDTSFIVRGSGTRMDDSWNGGNAHAAGRALDIYRTVVGNSQLTTFYAPVHLQCGLSGAFVAGDDVYGFRSLVRTETASGAGLNLDQMAGYRADIDHRSNQLVDEVYGYQAVMTASGTSATSIVTTMAGFHNTIAASGVTVTNAYGALLNSLTPSTAVASAGHIRCVPVQTATPATTLALMTGAQDGTIIYIEDTTATVGVSNSGFYFRMGGQWRALVMGVSDLIAARDATP